MKETIIAVGNGGYNLATDIIAAGLFPDARLIVCDTYRGITNEDKKGIFNIY